ncbi:hypothetical protein GCM10009743_04840 [Kribbella swartbergensis]
MWGPGACDSACAESSASTVAAAATTFGFGAAGSCHGPRPGSGQFVTGQAWMIALSRAIQPGDVGEDVLRVPHPGHCEYHDPAREQRDDHPQLPRHSLTALYSPRFPA